MTRVKPPTYTAWELQQQQRVGIHHMPSQAAEPQYVDLKHYTALEADLTGLETKYREVTDMLATGTVVYGFSRDLGNSAVDTFTEDKQGTIKAHKTHQGLLISVRPIERNPLETILKDLQLAAENKETISLNSYIERIKKIVETK